MDSAQPEPMEGVEPTGPGAGEAGAAENVTAPAADGPADAAPAAVAENDTATTAAAAAIEEIAPADAKRAEEALQQMKRIEAEFELLKQRLFEEKLEEVKEEIALAQQENHALLKEDLEKLSKQREDRIRAAERIRELQLQCLETAFEAEKKSAQDEYEAERAALKQRLLQHLSLRQKRLEEEREEFSLAVDTQEAMGKGPAFKRRKARATAADAAAQTQRRPRSFVPQITLSEDQITHDLVLISRALNPTATGRTAQTTRRTAQVQ